MNIKIKDMKECCKEFRYNKEDGNFELLDARGEVLEIINLELSLDDEYAPENFELRVLHNNRDDCTEESIYQVYVDKQRIGWIFPIQALCSKEHNYAQNNFFLKYAYVAWWNLLNMCDIEIESLDGFDLLSMFTEDTNFLVLDKDNCRKIKDFSYDKYIVSLFFNGYAETGTGNSFAQAVPHDKTMKLQRQSEALDDVPYITELFKKQIPNEVNPISRFYIYYQIIEILISKVFNDLFAKFVDDLQKDTGDLFEKREELTEYANEKYRVKRLCNEYCRIDTALKNELDYKCKMFLSNIDRRSGNGMHDNLYLVRCLIVHRMYILDESAKKILEEIDDLFLDLIIQMINSFRYHPIELSEVKIG